MFAIPGRGSDTHSFSRLVVSSIGSSIKHFDGDVMIRVCNSPSSKTVHTHIRVKLNRVVG